MTRENEKMRKELKRVDADIQKSFERIFKTSRKTFDFLADK
jgi:hypothetical protein